MFDESTKLYNVNNKIVFLGSSAVGKSAIIESFTQQQFDANKVQTAGIDFFVKNVTYKGATYKLQLWDTAGQQKFKILVLNYIGDAHRAVFVYDISRADTFASIDEWVQLFKKYKKYQAVMILVGNKADISVGRRVAQDTAEKKAASNEMSFCQTSTKIALGVEEMFLSIIENIKVSKSAPTTPSSGQARTRQQLSDCRLNKTKLVKNQYKKKKVPPCCYI